MKKHELDNKIETALDSLDHVSRVGPGPFFYTRVVARLQRRDRTLWEKISGFISQPAVAFAVIALVVSLNTLAIFQSDRSPAAMEQTMNISSSDDAELDIIAFYDEDTNNNTPQ